MPKKRQNRGRHKGSKGSTRTVQCDNCGRVIPRDKAICVTRWYTPVDPQLARELEKKGAIIMRYPVEKCYCVSCAVHYGIVQVRPEEERKSVRTPTI
ncbi:MAG: 30S ribosomal protein S26e [Thermoproteota archaeon]